MDKERQNQEEEQTIQKIQDKIKKVMFSVNNYLLKQVNLFSENIYYLLILIQTLQILWFSIHPIFTFISQSIGMSQLQTGIKYFSAEYYLRQNPGSWMICTIIAFVIIIIHVLTLIITGYLVHRKNITQMAQVMAKIANFQILLINTILTGPIFNIIITTLYCKPESAYHLGEVCYTPTGIIYCVLAAITGIVIIVQGILFALVYYVKNPFTRGCLNGPSNIYYIGKLCLKTLPSLYFIIDYDLQFIHVYLFAYVIVFAGYLFLFRMWSYHTYNQKFYYFIYGCEITLTWIGLINILQYYLSSSQRPNLNLIFGLMGAIPLCFTLIKLQKQSKKKIFLQGIRNIKKNKEVAQQFIYMVISLIQTSHIQKNKIQLLGFMKIHNSGCQLQESKCSCHQFFQDFYQRKKLSPSEQLHSFYLFLKHLLSDYIKKYSGHVIFKIIYAFLLYYKLDSKVQSVYYVTQTSKQKLSLIEQFMVFQLKLLFGHQSQQRQNDLSQDKGHAVRAYIQFNNLYMQLQDQIQSCAKNHLEYWRQLKQDFPSILKLWNLAKHFQMQIKNISSLYLKISDIYSNNVMTLILYSNFLKYIVLDQKEYSRLKQKIKTQNFSIESGGKDINQMKFRQNSNLCTITITTHMNNIGIIINTNSQLFKILGYSKTQLIGQKITKIMPKLYYDLHDSFVIKYLDRSDKQIQSKQFTVFALCKNGFLVECNILTKLIPEIANGFHLIGFIKKVEQTSMYLPHYIMYDGDSNNIEAVSETCVNSLGLTFDNIQKAGGTSNITINFLFPEVDFDQLDNRPQLKLEGFETILDTRVLSQDYVPPDSYSADSQTDYNKNGKMNVKVYLLKQSTYGKLKIKFIKFFILNQQQDQAKQSSKNITLDKSEQSLGSYYQQNDEKSSYKKYNQFISQGYTKCMIILLTIGIYIFMAMEVSLMSLDVARNIIDSDEISFSLNVLNESCTILNCLNNANFDTKKLKLTYQLELNQTTFKRYQKHMRQSANFLQSTIVQFIRTSVALQDRMHYYQPKIFSQFKFYNGNDTPITQTFQYNDALFEYITTIVAFSQYQYDVLNVPQITSMNILNNFYFVENNAMSTMFFATITNQVSIFDFFKQRFTVYLKSRQLLLGLRLASVMIVFCLILPIIVNLGKINNRLLGIYRLIPISDIIIIEESSLLFILNNFEDSSVSKSNEIDQPLTIKNGNLVENYQDIPLDNNRSTLPLLSGSFHGGQMSPLSTLRPAETSDALLISIDEQKVLLKRNSINKDLQQRKVPKVKLSQTPSNKNQIIFFCLLIAVMFGYCVSEYYIHHYFFTPFRIDQDSMTYYKTALSTNRQTLLNAQQYFSGGGNTALNNFNRSYDMLYFNLQALYDIQEDYNKNRQIIYGSVEQLKGLFSNPSIDTMKSDKFQRIQANIDQVQINLINQSNQWIIKTQQGIKNNFQKICFIKFAVQFAVVLLLTKILFSGYLEKVRMRTYRSISMAKMIPIKIVMKNQDILAIL